MTDEEAVRFSSSLSRVISAEAHKNSSEVFPMTENKCFGFDLNSRRVILTLVEANSHPRECEFSTRAIGILTMI